MGRPLRRHEPGQFYLVTNRCLQSRFLFRPDASLNGAVLEWLARAQIRYPRLRVLAVCVMSNHLHLVVRDEHGQLGEWAGYFFGNLARSVDRIRGRSGPCFARRYSAEPILDQGALLDRIVYVVTNPVKANLCKRARDWPGVLLFAGGESRVVGATWVDRDEFRLARIRATSRGGATPIVEDFRVQGQIVIDPIPSDPSSLGGVEGAVEAREQELGDERRRAGRKTLTRRQVLAQDWRSAPPNPDRSPRPLCHSADPSLRVAFHDGFREFVRLFREAAERLRCGEPNASFPDWSYPPGLPLVRAASGLAVGAG